MFVCLFVRSFVSGHRHRAMKSVAGLDGWRNYFRTANSDVFDIIENAIKVAASDCPKEFRVRRDRIAETLFSCKLTRCSSCARVEDGGGGCRNGFNGDGCEVEAGGSKESKVNSSRDDHGEMNMNQVTNYSYGEAEALTDEIEEQGQMVGEVLRIKEVLFNFEDESESVLFENLRRLQLMHLTVDILKTTEIGKAVNGLRKHGSKNIRNLARTLIDVWKDMVDEWVNASAAIASTPDSVNPSVVDEEEGLPSPPMDDFFATQPTSMELSRFFDGMDDDGNPRNSGDFTKSRDNGRRQPVEKPNVPKRKPEPRNELSVLSKDNKGQLMKKQEAPVRTNRASLSSTRSATGRPQKPEVELNAKSEAKCQQREEKVNTQKRSLNKRTNDDAVEIKLEATMRKLQERYHQAENAKKQRTIQVMELHDLPKQGLPKPVLGQRNPHMKPGNHNRHWASARH